MYCALRISCCGPEERVASDVPSAPLPAVCSAMRLSRERDEGPAHPADKGSWWLCPTANTDHEAAATVSGRAQHRTGGRIYLTAGSGCAGLVPRAKPFGILSLSQCGELSWARANGREDEAKPERTLSLPAQGALVAAVPAPHLSRRWCRGGVAALSGQRRAAEGDGRVSAIF